MRSSILIFLLLGIPFQSLQESFKNVGILAYYRRSKLNVVPLGMESVVDATVHRYVS